MRYFPAHFFTTPFATPVQNTLPNNLYNASLPDSSPTLPYNTSVQHSATTIPKPAHPCLTKTQKQYRPARPCVAERKNTMQPWIANDPGLQTHVYTDQRDPGLQTHTHTQTVQRPARPWIEKHTQNTQTSTTLDCKHPKSTPTPARPWNANSQKQYRDRHDPGLQHTEQKNRFSRNKNNHAQIRPKIMHLEQNRQKKAATYNAKYDGTDAFSEHAFSGFSVFVTCSCSVAAALKSPCTFWWFSFCREVSCCFCVRRCETVAGTSFYEIKRIHGIIIMFSRAKSQRKGL